jgi:hypothetical protein
MGTSGPVRPYRRLTVTIPVELYEQLTDASYEDMCSVAYLVRRAVVIHLKKRDQALGRAS